MTKAIYTKKEFKQLSPTMRIESIISDGMWYTFTKWRKIAEVSEEELTDWINGAIDDGRLIVSENGESYRFSLETIKDWYASHNLSIHDHLVDFVFPPRIWDGKTEVEGFLDAPRRDVGVVTFSCSPLAKTEIEERLRGIAIVRDENVRESKYKAYGLSANYIKNVINEVQKDTDIIFYEKIYIRSEMKRREIVDFTPEFAKNLILFYKEFGKTLVKSKQDTINIFLPTFEDQESHMLMWVIETIEKFDEKAAVPFSGYLNSVLSHRPYDLPEMFLGKELSKFQKEKSRAIKELKSEKGVSGDTTFTSQEIADKMGINSKEFTQLEQSHKSWIGVKSASSITWEENGEEKSSKGLFHGESIQSPDPSQNNAGNREKSHKLSVALIDSALESGEFKDAISVISQMDKSNLDLERIEKLSKGFKLALGRNLGMMSSEEESN